MAEKKSYKNLTEEVWDAGTCSGCGGCVAVCPADALFFIDEPGINHPSSSGYCKMETDSVPCGACYDACPRTREQKKDTIGSYRKLVRAQATTAVPHQQNGGAVTAILLAAMQEGLIDGVVTVTEDRWNHKPSSILVTSAGELIEHAGSRYNWSVPVLRSLKTAIIEKKLTRVVIVGTPCVAQAARAMKNSSNDLLIPFGRSIRLIIGLFCTESFDYHTLMEEIFVTADWADWLTRFTKAGITFGPIARSDDHLECPQVAANGMLPEMEGAGGMRTVDSPICIAGEKKTPPRRAPEIGEHTREILASMGIAGAEIDRIIASGAARA
ncbi:MAG: hypothetical protein CVT73_20775 [Alphaproteobacteria bacterium HGW-Alphaproteobacteria-12]|nr:MAG: hypothetical protein CVT73_20775 [Alphaproteobacteria bacterium HGW-Alphaproteobacteria-12]